MTARGAVTPMVETLSSPARIVVDLPNTVMATAQSRVRVGSDGVNEVRIGTDAAKTTRVVVDLDRLCKYELVPGPGEKLTLKLEMTPAVESASAPPLGSRFKPRQRISRQPKRRKTQRLLRPTFCSSNPHFLRRKMFRK